MPYELSPEENELDPIATWPAGDSRRLSFTVTQDGSPKDITNDGVEWWLAERPYDALADALLSTGDSRVTVQRDTVVDPTAGEFRIDIAEDPDADLWGSYYQVVVVDPPGDSRQSWVGPVVVDGSGTE